jgi:hypothetical protein
MTQLKKKSKLLNKDTIINIIGNYNVAQLDNEIVNSVELENNFNIQSLNDFKKLLHLSLINTNITNINNCPRLSYLKISDNDQIKKVKSLDSVKKIDFDNLQLLHTITLNTVNHITINNCNELMNINTGHSLKYLSLSNCKKIHNLPSLNSLVNLYLNNINIDSLVGLSIPLKLLSIKNCNQLLAAGEFDHIELIKINGCKKLQTVYNLSHCNDIYIKECDDLTEVYTLKDANSITIKCCNQFHLFKRNSTNLLHISNCMNIKCLRTSMYKSLTLEYCLKFELFYITNISQNIYINNCRNAICSIAFQDKDRATQTNLTIHGESQIRYLHDIYLNKLSLVNTSVESIKNSYFNNISINECKLLSYMKNVLISNELIIKDCNLIESIESLKSIKKIKLYNLFNLTKLTLCGSYDNLLTSLHAIDCNKLNLMHSGNKLTDIKIISCGVPLFDDICNVKTFILNKCKLINDISSEDTSLKNVVIDYYTQKTNLAFSAKVLKRFFYTIKFNKSITKLHILNSIKSCTICLDTFNVGDNIYLTKCMHKFHTTCLDAWLDYNNKCPLCLYINP